MLRLSFIVPFYGVEKYIEECIRSLYNQDIPQEEYEVICVDDCSPDGSRAVVERLQKEYSTLRLLTHTENKRQGGARNTGMQEAKGRYIWFVDSDDYIKSNCLRALLEQAEKEDLDVLKFHFAYENQVQRDLSYSKGVELGTDLIFNEDLEVPLISRCCSAVSQLIRRELLKSNNIVFAEKVQYEDDDFAYQIYAYAKRARLIGIAPYIVRMSPNSTTRRELDYRRVHDIYVQAIRMASIDASLSRQDVRWHMMITKGIHEGIDNCVFRMLRSCSRKEQILFWARDKGTFSILKPYLSRKSYAKLCSYILWLLLQK